MSAVKSLKIPSLFELLTFIGFVSIVRVTIGVLLNYRDYFPPNFQSEFLSGREEYFAGWYCWAFYVHLISGPVSLILATFLISERLRVKYRVWHRYLGRIAIPCILVFVAPSGLWMAFYVDTGPSAVVGFVFLSLLTGLFATMGWRAAIRRRYDEHRRCMWRCFLMLCSAVVLRLIAGTVVASGFEAAWVFPLAAWGSWLLPLLVFELRERLRANPARRLLQPVAIVPASDTSS